MIREGLVSAGNQLDKPVMIGEPWPLTQFMKHEILIKISGEILRSRLAWSTMAKYLDLKRMENDWHGVQDAASDMRDIDSETNGLEIAYGIAKEYFQKETAPNPRAADVGSDAPNSKETGNFSTLSRYADGSCVETSCHEPLTAPSVSSERSARACSSEEKTDSIDFIAGVIVGVILLGGAMLLYWA